MTPAPCVWAAQIADHAQFGKGNTTKPAYARPEVSCTWDAAVIAGAATQVTALQSLDTLGVDTDGLTDVATALQAAIDTAGDNATLGFVGGKTYVLCRTVEARKGQRWTRVGAGEAVLKRCDERTTVLANGATELANSVTVVDSSEFAVGMGFGIVASGKSGYADGSRFHHTITKIDGATLTFWPALKRAFVKGDKVFTAFDLVRVSAAAVRLDGLVFDGNRDKNASYHTWETNHAIYAGGGAAAAAGFLVDKCVFREQSNDAIALTGCADCAVRRSFFHDSNGTTVHLSSTTNTEFGWNTVRRVAQQAAEQHHTEGAVTWSLYVQDPHLHHNCIEDVEVAAFGTLMPSPYSVGGSVGGLFEANVVIDTAGFVRAVNGALMDADVEPIVVRDNLCVNCGNIVLYGNVKPAGALLNAPIIEGNRLFGGGVDLGGAASATVIGNVFIDTTNAAFVWPQGELKNNMGRPAIRTMLTPKAQLRSNIVIGSERGMWLRTIDGESTGMAVEDNQLLGQRWAAMTLGDANHISLPKHKAALTGGMAITGNKIVHGAAAGSVRAAVHVGQRTQFHDNCVQTPADGILGFGHTGDGAKDETHIVNNKIGGARSIHTPGSAGGFLVAHNTLQGSVDNKLGQAKTSTVASNKSGPVQCNACWPDPAGLTWIPAGVPAKLAP